VVYFFFESNLSVSLFIINGHIFSADLEQIWHVTLLHTKDFHGHGVGYLISLISLFRFSWNYSQYGFFQ